MTKFRHSQEILSIQDSSVQSLSRVWLLVTPWTAACQASLSITNSWSLFKLISIESVMPSNHLILCRPLLLQSFPASGSFLGNQFFASGGQSIGVLALASVLPMNIQGWFPLGLIGFISLQSKGLKSFLQHHSSKASILRCSGFFIVQCSHPYMTTGKTIALTRWTFVGTICTDFGVQKNKVCHCFHRFPIYLPWSDGTPKYTQTLTMCCHMEEVVKCCMRVTVFYFYIGMEYRISSIKNEYCTWGYWIFQ